jgi:hypothetical protein
MTSAVAVDVPDGDGRARRLIDVRRDDCESVRPVEVGDINDRRNSRHTHTPQLDQTRAARRSQNEITRCRLEKSAQLSREHSLLVLKLCKCSDIHIQRRRPVNQSERRPCS